MVTAERWRLSMKDESEEDEGGHIFLSQDGEGDGESMRSWKRRTIVSWKW